ncbi:MAG: hypothetical protein ACPIOQ_85230, partial [Promethearchaeia archaeon]
QGIREAARLWESSAYALLAMAELFNESQHVSGVSAERQRLSQLVLEAEIRGHFDCNCEDPQDSACPVRCLCLCCGTLSP